VEIATGIPCVICKHCREVRKHPTLGTQKTPSDLGKHLGRCNKYQTIKREREGKESRDGGLFKSWFGSEDKKTVTGDALRERILRFIISANLPFLVANDPELQSLLEEGFPGVKPPNRHTVTRLLGEKAVEAKEALVHELANIDSKVSLALDMWTTRTQLAFLGKPLYAFVIEMVTSIDRRCSFPTIFRLLVKCNGNQLCRSMIMLTPVTFLNMLMNRNHSALD
jgi:hypothetical protein